LQRLSGVTFKRRREVINDLLDVPGNRSFREAIEALACELMRR
jgi:hypothetical protein